MNKVDKVVYKMSDNSLNIKMFILGDHRSSRRKKIFTDQQFLD